MSKPVDPVAEDLFAAHAAYRAARTPVEVARDAVNAAVWDAVDELVGAPELGTGEWATWYADPAAQRERYRVSVAVVHELRLDPRGWIRNATAAGVTWAEVGTILGITRQAAHLRYKTDPQVRAAAQLALTEPARPNRGAYPPEVVPPEVAEQDPPTVDPPKVCCICGAAADLVRYRHAEIAGGPRQWACRGPESCATRHADAQT